MEAPGLDGSQQVYQQPGCLCGPTHDCINTPHASGGSRGKQRETHGNTRMLTHLHARFLSIIPFFFLLTTHLSRAVWFDFNVTLKLHLTRALFRSPPLCPFILSAHPFFLHSLPPVSSPAGRQHVNYSPQMQIFPCARQDLQWRLNFPSFKLL